MRLQFWSIKVHEGGSEAAGIAYGTSEIHSLNFRYEVEREERVQREK